MRFGVANSALWATATTAASNVSVNSMHDSYTPLGGLVPLWLIQLGEVVSGGVGSGLYGMLMFAIVAVFVAGLMIGRTPEYLYLTKPFGAAELLARVHVALRHAARVAGSAGESEFSVGPLRVDLLNRKVWVADREVHLTPIEYRLLSVLVKHAGKTLTHRQLLHAVWGSARADSSHYLRIYMGQLRRKLEADQIGRAHD